MNAYIVTGNSHLNTLIRGCSQSACGDNTLLKQNQRKKFPYAMRPSILYQTTGCYYSLNSTLRFRRRNFKAFSNSGCKTKSLYCPVHASKWSTFFLVTVSLISSGCLLCPERTCMTIKEIEVKVSGFCGSGVTNVNAAPNVLSNKWSYKSPTEIHH